MVLEKPVSAKNPIGTFYFLVAFGTRPFWIGNARLRLRLLYEWSIAVY